LVVIYCRGVVHIYIVMAHKSIVDVVKGDMVQMALWRGWAAAVGSSQEMSSEQHCRIVDHKHGVQESRDEIVMAKDVRCHQQTGAGTQVRIELCFDRYVTYLYSRTLLATTRAPARRLIVIVVVPGRAALTLCVFLGCGLRPCCALLDCCCCRRQDAHTVSIASASRRSGTSLELWRCDRGARAVVLR
jgi:hypothetical protein